MFNESRSMGIFAMGVFAHSLVIESKLGSGGGAHSSWLFGDLLAK